MSTTGESKRFPVAFIDAFRYRLDKEEARQLSCLRDDSAFRRMIFHLETEIRKVLHLNVYFDLLTHELHFKSKENRDIRAGMTHEGGSIEWSCEGLMPNEYAAAYYFFCQLRSHLALDRGDPRYREEYLIARGSHLKWPVTEEDAEALINLRKKMLSSEHKRATVQAIVEGILFGQDLQAKIDWENWEVDFGNDSDVRLRIKDRIWLGSNLNEAEGLFAIVIICTLFSLSRKL